MIPLKTGPYLALDASSSGDSYFVKIKLKSISNVPAVCCSRGVEEALVPTPAQPRGLRSGWWPPGRAARPRLGVKFRTRCRPLRGLLLEEGRGWRAGLLWAALNQNPTHKGQPTVAPSKETQLLSHLLEVFLQVRRVLGWHRAVSPRAPGASLLRST